MPVRNVVIGQKVSSEKRRLAKELRQDMTPAEKILWQHLRMNKLNGLHFRRQQIVYGYLADFYCHEHALIVELDGGIHETQKDYDAARETHLAERGFRIVRFKNEEVEKDLNGVLRKILEECKQKT
jgi:very-short-patch-repair endonuclease